MSMLTTDAIYMNLVGTLVCGILKKAMDKL